MKLYDRKSGLELKRGDAVETFRGEKGKLVYASEPHKVSSTGRVNIEYEDGTRREFFPSVISAVWLHTHFQAYAKHTERYTEAVLGEFPNLTAITLWLETQSDEESPEGFEHYARDLTTEEIWWLDGDEWKLQEKDA